MKRCYICNKNEEYQSILIYIPVGENWKERRFMACGECCNRMLKRKSLKNLEVESKPLTTEKGCPEDIKKIKGHVRFMNGNKIIVKPHSKRFKSKPQSLKNSKAFNDNLTIPQPTGCGRQCGKTRTIIELFKGNKPKMVKISCQQKQESK